MTTPRDVLILSRQSMDWMCEQDLIHVRDMQDGDIAVIISWPSSYQGWMVQRVGEDLTCFGERPVDVQTGWPGVWSESGEYARALARTYDGLVYVVRRGPPQSAPAPLSHSEGLRVLEFDDDED